MLADLPYMEHIGASFHVAFPPPQKCSTQFTLTKKTWAPQHHLVHRHLVRFVVLAISQRRFNSHLLKNKNILPETNSKKNLKKTRAVWFSGRCSGAFEVFLFLGKGIHQLSSRVTRTHQNSKKQLQVSLKVSCFFFELGKLSPNWSLERFLRGMYFSIQLYI